MPVSRGTVLTLILSAGLAGCVSTRPTQAPVGEPALAVVELASGDALAYAELDGPRDLPLVLYVHGTPGSWSSFRRVMQEPHLSGRLRQISIDRPGWGESYRPRRNGSKAGTEPSLERQSAVLLELLDRLAPGGRAIVVGHSLGAPIAARFAAEHPQRTAGLLLVAGSIDPELEKPTWYQRLGRTWMVRWLLPRTLVAADEEILPLRDELEALSPLWERIEAPVVALHGTKDRLVPVANVDFARRKLESSLDVRLLEGRGHLLHVKETARIAEAVWHLAETDEQSRSAAR